MSELDLEQVITDSVNDAVNPEPEIDDIGDPVSQETTTLDPPVVLESNESTAPDSTEVPSPATQETDPTAPTTEEPQDEFAKLAGIPQNGVTGRENRIPYSRVKKITEKAVVDAESKIVEAAIGRKLNQGEKPVDAVKSIVAQIPELQGKVTDYETRLNTVGQFENVMANDPQQFLTMLSKLPAYQQFFQFVEQSYNALQAGAQPAQAGATATQPVAPDANMPEPDETLSDGSKVYSLEGLKKLLSWNAQQVETRVAKQFEDRYKSLEDRYQPIRNEWEQHKYRQSVIPQIRAQIDDARKWPLFNENEAEITDLLAKDRSLSLEAAYRQAVFPKMIAERNSMRQDILKEIKTAPTATAVTGRQLKPTVPSDSPRSLEDIIKESIETIKS